MPLNKGLVSSGHYNRELRKAVHIFYAQREYAVLPISRIDRMRGGHSKSPADVLASQYFKYVRK